jgi:hypothetical protein
MPAIGLPSLSFKTNVVPKLLPATFVPMSPASWHWPCKWLVVWFHETRQEFTYKAAEL